MLDPKKILIIEDDSAVQFALSDLLSDSGYLVEAASNGVEGLYALRNGAALPDLILLDIMMPIMDGFQFRAEQLSDPKLSFLPVIVMTADGRLQEKTVKLEAVAGLSKPFDIEKLLEVVKAHSH